MCDEQERERYDGMSKDHITEIEQISQMMTDHERLLETLFLKTPDAIISIGVNGVVNHPFNPAACEMFGYKPADLLGKTVTMLMPPPHSVNHQSYIRRYLETGNGTVVGKIRVVEALHADGHLFPIELSVTEIGEGSEKSFMAIIRRVVTRGP